MLSADGVNSKGFKCGLKGLGQIFCLEIHADGLSKHGHDWSGVIFGSNVWLSINKYWMKYENGVVREGERKCEAKWVVYWDIWSQK